MSDILLIGSGYIGQALARYWKDRPMSLTATTTRPERLEELKALGVGAAVWSSKQPAKLVELLNGVTSVVITVAAPAAEDYSQTYLGTAEALLHALPDAPSVRQVIYTSSTSVYGDCNGEWIDEERLPIPTNSSQQVLLDTERLLISAQSPVRHVCVLRLGEIIGPGRSIVARLQRMQGQPLPGSGDNYVNLSPQADVVRAIDFALAQNLAGVYNVCNELHVTRAELYAQICHAHGWPAPQWGSATASLHRGNKRVRSDRIKQAGFSFIYPNEWEMDENVPQPHVRSP